MNTKRRIAVLLITVMVMSVFFSGIEGNTVFVFADSNTATQTDAENIPGSDVYSGTGFNVEFNLETQWNGGYNATITITNTSDEVIENWGLILPLNNSISNIWKASIQENNDDFYVIKNAGWNQDIPVNGSVSFGITCNEEFLEYPSSYAVIGQKIETDNEDYSIEYMVKDSWEDGIIGEIVITNLREKPIEDWRLSFHYDNKITDVWNGKIISCDNGDYVISCADYKQNIIDSISIGFRVEIGNEYNLPENFRVYEYNMDYEDGKIYVMGSFDDYSGTILISYASTTECKEYNIYCSDDGENYTLYKTQDDDTSIEIDIKDDFSQIYVEGKTDKGVIVSDFVIIQIEDDINITNADYDEDMLCDYLEFVYGSDMEIEDTDDDNLSDYYEIYYSKTDPTLIDTDEDGISDYDEDFDEDGLSNGLEVKYNTHPYIYDTDRDGLSDYDEIMTHKTDPLNDDTDGDFLVDGDDIELGFNPLLADTDSNGVIDSKEYVKQQASYDIISGINPIINRVIVDMECSGVLKKNIKFEDMFDKDTYVSDVVGLLGDPIEINVNTSFNEATISFQYDEESLKGTKEEDLLILWYDKKNDDFVMMDSDVDTEKNTVSCKTTHFSTYLVVDREIWLDCWREDINYRTASEIKYYDIVFAVDVSGSMSGSRITLAKTALKSFVKALMPNDRAGLVSFNNKAYKKIQLDNPYDSSISAYDNVIDSLKASGGTDANVGVLKAIEMLELDVNTDNEKIIILICDGDVNVSNSTIIRAKSDGIVINCLNVSSGSEKDLKNIAYSTGGAYYYAATSADIKKKIEQIKSKTIDSIDMTDTDGDGLYDVFEVNGMKLSNGRVIYTDKNKIDSDGDGISDRDELGGLSSKKQIYIDGDLYSCTLFHSKSHPGFADSDKDGIPDSIDTNPKVKDRIDIASLVNENYITIFDPSRNKSYGGNQAWWDGKVNLIKRCGCGLIACSDVELYLSLYNSKCSENGKNISINEEGVVDYNSYIDYVNSEFWTYKIKFGRIIPPDQVDPWVMTAGLDKYYESAGLNYKTYWQPSDDPEVINTYIINNINNNIPVITSYDNLLSETDCTKEIRINDKKTKKYHDCLPCYDCETNSIVKNKIKSHYFVITGVSMVYNADLNVYDRYYQISSWGEKYSIKADDFLNNLNWFTTIIYTDVE